MINFFYFSVASVARNVSALHQLQADLPHKDAAAIELVRSEGSAVQQDFAEPRRNHLGATAGYLARQRKEGLAHGRGNGVEWSCLVLAMAVLGLAVLGPAPVGPIASTRTPLAPGTPLDFPGFLGLWGSLAIGLVPGVVCGVIGLL